MKWDVFISHASEDKEQVARPLADVLKGMGFSVWLDENELTVGDSLVDKINNGISNSRYGIVILSKNFFAKDWPQKELNALVSIETKQDKVILPIWHNLSKKDISIHSPLLADKLAVSSSSGISDLASEIVKVLEYNNTEKKPTKENELFSPKLGYFLLDKHKTSLTKNILYGVISFFAVALIAVAYETFYKKQYPESEVYISAFAGLIFWVALYIIFSSTLNYLLLSFLFKNGIFPKKPSDSQLYFSNPIKYILFSGKFGRYLYIVVMIILSIILVVSIGVLLLSSFATAGGDLETAPVVAAAFAAIVYLIGRSLKRSYKVRLRIRTND